MNLTISIGRNVGDVPLDDKEWGSFVQDVRNIATLHTCYVPLAQIIQFGTVTGGWNGKREESFTITIADVSRKYKDSINEKLSTLCKVYRQDAIAATWYKPSFIS